MTILLTEPSAAERTLAVGLQERAKDAMKSRDINEVAEALGLAPSGVASLLWQDEWGLERAIRVADALGVIDRYAALDALTCSARVR